MIKSFYNRKAQSLVEAAAFGVVILLSFTVLVRYMQKLNGEQYELMGSIRRSLKKSHDENAIVSFAILNDSRQADVEHPLRKRRIMRSGSGYVHWAVPAVDKDNLKEEIFTTSDYGYFSYSVDSDNDTTSEKKGDASDVGNDPARRFYYRVNDEEPEQKLPQDANVTGVDTRYREGIEDKVLVYENEGGIHTQRHVGVDEQMTYTIKGGPTVNQNRSHHDSNSFYRGKY